MLRGESAEIKTSLSYARAADHKRIANSNVLMCASVIVECGYMTHFTDTQGE